MEPPTWNTGHITVTDKGRDVLKSIDTTLFFDSVADATAEAEEHGLHLLDEGTFRLVFTDPTNELVTGDVVIKLRKNQSGYQMNQTEYYGHENAPDWLRPFLVPALGSDDYVVMPRCDTNNVSSDQFIELRDYIKSHNPTIADSRELHHKNVGLHNGTPVIFDYAVGFQLF